MRAVLSFVGTVLIAFAGLGAYAQQASQGRDLSQMEQDRDRQWNNGSVASLESRIRQSVPKSEVSVTMKDWRTVVLSGVVANKRDRQTIEQMVRDQDPRMQVVDNLRVGNVGPFGETPAGSGSQGGPK